MIFRPIVLGRRRGPEGAEEDAAARVLQRATTLFERSQVEPIPGRALPLEAPEPAPIDGDTHAHLIARCERFAAELGFDVERAPIEGGALGCCDHARRRIAVAVGLSANAEAHVLVHELAHAMGVGYRTHGRERAECIVECAAYLTLAAQGLDVEAASVPYLAGWAAEDLKCSRATPGRSTGSPACSNGRSVGRTRKRP